VTQSRYRYAVEICPLEKKCDEYLEKMELVRRITTARAKIELARQKMEDEDGEDTIAGAEDAK